MKSSEITAAACYYEISEGLGFSWGNFSFFLFFFLIFTPQQLALSKQTGALTV